ncbi:cortical protein marker for cell polarity-domain-containing protein [Paraphysoderma sedebokerense]|nr:cortical protein marker for cell polarity-domain-containing protein [Paraphysoderma sedebokerense]
MRHAILANSRILLTCLTLSAYVTFVLSQAASPPPSVPSHPIPDLNKLGETQTLHLIGHFSGASLFPSLPLAATSSSSNENYSLAVAKFPARILDNSTSPSQSLPSTVLKTLSTLDGPVNDVCVMNINPRGTGDAKKENWYFVGGKFASVTTYVAGVGNRRGARTEKVGNIMAITEDGKVWNLGNGLNGPVTSLYCDTSTESIYMGGYFTSTLTTPSVPSSHLIRFSLRNSTWVSFPGSGLNGPVLDISITNLTNNNAKNLIISGSFSATGESILSVPSLAQMSFVQVENAGNTGAGAVQIGGNGWCGNLKEQSVFQVSGERGSAVMKLPAPLKLRGIQILNRGVKTFRLSVRSGNGSIPLTLYSPIGQTCSTCPLSASSTAFQDFRVATTNVEGSEIQVDVIAVYEPNGGFADFRASHNDIIVYSFNQYNTLSCPDMPPLSPVPKSQAIVFGTAQPVQRNSYSFLQFQPQQSPPSVTYEPAIIDDGNYVVSLFVPPCQSQNCQRTTVTVRTFFNADNLNQATSETTINQETAAGQSIRIYNGFIASNVRDGVVGAKINIVMTSNNAQQVMVADSVVFTKVSSRTDLSSIILVDPQSLSTQNTLSIYQPLQNLPSPSIFTSVIELRASNSYLVAGAFGVNDVSNIAEYRVAENRLQPMRGGGLNGFVKSMAQKGNDIFIAGEFTGPTGSGNSSLRYIARYNAAEGRWSSVAGGINGPASTVLFSNEKVYFSGTFSQYVSSNVSSNGTSASPCNGLISYDTASDSLSLPIVHTSGEVTALKTFSSSPKSPADSLIVASRGVTHTIRSNAIMDLPWTSSTEKGTVNPSSALMGTALDIFGVDPKITFASWYNTTVGQLLLVGGNFRNEKRGIKNIALWDGKEWKSTAKDSKIDTVTTMALSYPRLYVAGQATASSSDMFEIYDISTNTKITTIPTAFTGGSPTMITSIRRSSNGNLFVMGNFKKIMEVECQNICVLDGDRWAMIGNGLNGAVSTSAVVEDMIVVAGNFTSPSPYLTTLDVNSKSFEPLIKDNTLPGPVTTVLGDSLSSLYIAGFKSSSPSTNYISKWDGSSLRTIDAPTGLINRIYMLPVTPDSPRIGNDMITAGGVLVALGKIELTNSKVYSMVLFDGANWHPFASTSAADGSPGTAYAIVSDADLRVAGREFLSKPIVIVISVGISLALVLLGSAISLFGVYVKRRRQRAMEPIDLPPPRRDSAGTNGSGKRMSRISIKNRFMDNIIDSLKYDQKSSQNVVSPDTAVFSKTFGKMTLERNPTALKLQQESKNNANELHPDVELSKILASDLESQPNQLDLPIAQYDSPQSESYESATTFPASIPKDDTLTMPLRPLSTFQPSVAYEQEADDERYDNFGSEYEELAPPRSSSMSPLANDQLKTLSTSPFSFQFPAAPISPPSAAFSHLYEDLNSHLLQNGESVGQTFLVRYNFNSSDTETLNLKPGDQVQVLDSSDDIWWIGVKVYSDSSLREIGKFPRDIVDRGVGDSSPI